MKQGFSTNWKASTQPRKQRKYRANAPMHTLGKYLHVHLLAELRKKHGVRATRVRKGDKVKVLRGSHKGVESKVDRVDITLGKVYLQKVEKQKKEGGVVAVAFNPTNLLITTLDLSDKKRALKLKKEE